MKGWSRREESATRKGKAPVAQMRDSTQEEKTIVSRKMWSNLFPPSVDRRQGHRSSSESLPLRSSSPFSEVRNLEVDFETRSQMERGIRESPIFRCLLSRKCKSRSREETSMSRGEADSRNSHLEEDKEGFTGRVGYDPRGSSVTDLPFIPRIRGKGIIFEGNCKISGAENMEVHQPFSSQPPESSYFPSCSLEMLLPSPFGPYLPNSVSLSQSSTVNQGNSNLFFYFFFLKKALLAL